MPLFSNEQSRLKLVVYFEDKTCFTRLSFIRKNESKELTESLKKFKDAIEFGYFGNFKISDYKTAIIYDNRVIPNKIIGKWVNGARVI